MLYYEFDYSTYKLYNINMDTIRRAYRLKQAERTWLTSSEGVANIQEFFGISILKASVRDEDPSSKCTQNSTGKIVNGDVDINKNNPGCSQNDPSIALKDKQNIFSTEPPNHQLRIEYKINNYYWYWLLSFGAFLGDYVFYYLFIPFWLYNINPWVMRRIVLMWGICMYIGQASKEVLRWSRPASPPVVPLEPRYFKEYGMPSTHAMVGTLFPFGILFLTMGKVEYYTPVGFLIASAWTLLVCFSRLYKGMHYILDVIVGVVVTFILMAAIFPFLDRIDEFLITNSMAPLVITGTITFLSLMYPSARGWSSTRMDTIVILSSAGSIYTSLWLNNYFQLYPDRYNDYLPDHITWPSLIQLGAMCCRMAIGLITMLLTLLIVKPTLLAILSFIYSIEINAETKKWLSVEFPYKYVMYTIVILAFMLVSPFVFQLVGL